MEMRKKLRANQDGKDRTDGILVFLEEISRVSHTPGLTQWCTPGHNRGQALEATMGAPDEAEATEPLVLVSVERV